jgi:VanZ family protein
VLRLVRLAAWTALPVLALLSLLPKDEMVRTGADGRLEHFVAYAGTMALFALGYGVRFGVARSAAALIAYACVMELGQHVAPGRSPAIVDFAAGAVGVATTAMIAAWLLRGSRTRPRAPRS